MFAPLSHLPYLWSCAIWLLLTGLAYLFAMLKVLPHRLTILLALAAPTAMFNVIETETGFMVAALIGFALAMLERRPMLAGLAIGLLTMKPQFGLLFPFILIASGNWRGFWSAAATALVIAAVTCLVFGPAVWSVYLHSMPTVGAAVLGEGDRVRLMDGGTIAWCDIQTWYGVARYLDAPPGVTWMVYGATTGACLLLVSWLWRQPVSHNLKSAATAVAAPLVTPYMMSYDLVVVAVAIAFLVRENLRSGFRRGDIEIYCIVLAVPLYPLFVNGIVPLLPLIDSILFAWILHRAWGSRAEQTGVTGSVSNEQNRRGVTIGASPAR